jgi:hypothetical protein
VSPDAPAATPSWLNVCNNITLMGP